MDAGRFKGVEAGNDEAVLGHASSGGVEEENKHASTGLSVECRLLGHGAWGVLGAVFGPALARGR